jgi:flagellin FlaB
MLNRIARAFKNLHRSEKGMTGLETAIILIAFVTVASVLAYSVLTAGIFAAERGKETIYKGLESARSTIHVKSSVLGFSNNLTKMDVVQFNVGIAIPNDKVDTNAVVINYWDAEVHAEGLTFTMDLAAGSAERGAPDILENDEQFTCTITTPASANLTAYKSFTLQLMAPTGAALTIKRTLPGNLYSTMDLQ